VLKILNGQTAVFQNVAKGFGLAVRKPMLLDQHVPSDGLLTSLSDFGKLGSQPLDKILQPAGQVPIGSDLPEMIVSFAYSEVLSRPGLDLKHRQLATIAALTALGTATVQLRFHIGGGLNVGLTVVEIREIIMLMSVYAGFPAAINGTLALKEVALERKLL
jgi:4-carboxymuconolactone decarboxylase